MRVRLDSRFGEEQRRFGLRFTCRDCMYFRERDASCGHFWPNAEHLDPPSPPAPEDPPVAVLFCKEFELA